MKALSTAWGNARRQHMRGKLQEHGLPLDKDMVAKAISPAMYSVR